MILDYKEWPEQAVGAMLPFFEHQAQDATTNGTVIGPCYRQNELATEACERMAVTLERGQFIDFELTAPANSIVVRYNIPDTHDSSVYVVPLTVLVNGVTAATLSLTNAYTWRYGAYPFTKKPLDGRPQHFFDEVHALLPAMKRGTKVRLVVETADAVTIDVIDFENVAPPLAQPLGSVSVIEHGADPTGRASAKQAFDAAIEAARAADATVWIPPGTYRIDEHLVVDEVTIRGAGMWHTILSGDSVGVYGRWARQGGSHNVHLADFQIEGRVWIREDDVQVNGIGGALSDSTIERVWIEHTKVGAWLDGPFDRLELRDLRIRCQMADGINFHDGVTNSTVTGCHIRGVGDDGLAMWSAPNEDVGNTFSYNTIDLVFLANGIAIYGGRDNSVIANLVRDAGINEGGGIHVGNRFGATAVAGTTTIADNEIVRSGNLDRNWNCPVGALWFDARDQPLDGVIVVKRLEIRDSPLTAVAFVSGARVENVELEDVEIDGAGAYAVQTQVDGAATFRRVSARRVGRKGIGTRAGTSFEICDGGGNVGWARTLDSGNGTEWTL